MAAPDSAEKNKHNDSATSIITSPTKQQLSIKDYYLQKKNKSPREQQQEKSRSRKDRSNADFAFTDSQTKTKGRVTKPSNSKSASQHLNIATEAKEPENIVVNKKIASFKEFQIPKSKKHFTVPENRFKLKPGMFWDGLDRSNGFEKKYLLKREEKMIAKKER